MDITGKFGTATRTVKLHIYFSRVLHVVFHKACLELTVATRDTESNVHRDGVNSWAHRA